MGMFSSYSSPQQAAAVCLVCFGGFSRAYPAAASAVTTEQLYILSAQLSDFDFHCSPPMHTSVIVDF
jgi:hypothetical protein